VVSLPLFPCGHKLFPENSLLRRLRERFVDFPRCRDALPCPCDAIITGLPLGQAGVPVEQSVFRTVNGRLRLGKGQ
jgi:hypothetical protein